MKTITFRWIVFGFLLWNSGLLLINPPKVMGQNTDILDQKAMKALMKQMIPNRLPPGISPEKLPEPNSLGAKLLQKYCIQCHDIFSPRMHSAGKWSSMFQRMAWHVQMMPRGRKMDRRIQIEVPSSQEETELLIYLKRHSLHAADQSNLEHLDTHIELELLSLLQMSPT